VERKSPNSLCCWFCLCVRRCFCCSVVVGGDLFCRDQEEEEEVMAMAKVFCKTPSKSGGKVGKWERCPLKDCISPEPVVKSKTPGRPSDRFITDRSAMDFNVASFRLGMKENSFTDAVHSPSKVCDLKFSLCSFLVLGLNELQTLAFPILNPCFSCFNSFELGMMNLADNISQLICRKNTRSSWLRIC
jgi:hypothetical protein